LKENPYKPPNGTRKSSALRPKLIALGTPIALAWSLIVGNWLLGVFRYGPSPGGFLYDISLVLAFALTVGTAIGLVIGFVVLVVARLL
jgi:hypothetical protein